MQDRRPQEVVVEIIPEVRGFQSRWTNQFSWKVCRPFDGILVQGDGSEDHDGRHGRVHSRLRDSFQRHSRATSVKRMLTRMFRKEDVRVRFNAFSGESHPDAADVTYVTFVQVRRNKEIIIPELIASNRYRDFRSFVVAPSEQYETWWGTHVDRVVGRRPAWDVSRDFDDWFPLCKSFFWKNQHIDK